MKVILLSDIYKHGVAGEVVEVSDGYARNYLIPKRLAAKATPGELKRAEKLQETAAARKAELEGRLNELGRQIDGVELVFGRRAAVTGKLFGSVTTTEIAEALNEQIGIDINRRRISQQALRELGTYEIPVRLGTDVSPILKVHIVREDEVENFLTTRQASAESAAEPETGGIVDTVTEVVENVAQAVSDVVEDAVEAVAEAVTPDDEEKTSAE